MPGMNSGLSPADPILVAAFRSALLHQGAIALLIFAFLWLLWATARTWRLTMPAAKPAAGQAAEVKEAGDAAGTAETETDGAGQTSGATETGGVKPVPGTSATGGARGARGTWATGGVKAGRGSWAPAKIWAERGAGRGGTAEPRGRWLLRVGFGLVWILDGILQTQPKMAGGLATQVIEPIAAASPSWVQHLINWGGTSWSFHPVEAAAASVWIQAGIGGWLLIASRGTWSRLAGLAAVAWGLVVWVFGESFGGIFAPGLSWLTGAPGAVLIYVVAGALVALPEEAWRSPRIGRLLLGGTGLFFIGMAVLQAWPGRGFWQGVSHGQPGTLAGMVQQMSSTQQPHFLSALLSDFGSFAASNGFAVNLVVVIALAAMGAVFLTGRPGWSVTPCGSDWCSAWRTGCWSRTSDSWADSAPTRTA